MDAAQFEADTRVGDVMGGCDVEIPARWSGLGDGVYGGFVAALAMRGAQPVAGNRPPASLHCRYLRPLVASEPVRLRTVPVREGRRVTVVDVHLGQRGRVAVTAAVTAASVRQEASVPEFGPEPPPQLGGDPHDVPTLASELEARGLDPDRVLTMLRHCDFRNLPDAGDGVFRTWFRLGDGAVCDHRWTDAARGLLALDGFGGATFTRLGAIDDLRLGRSDFVPANLDLLVHFAGGSPWPATEWLLSETRADAAAGGLSHGAASLWASDGRLLATATAQLLLSPRRRGTTTRP